MPDSAIENWLRENGLSVLAPIFVDNDIDMDVLRELNEADLRELGLSMGQRKRLLRALQTVEPTAAKSQELPQVAAPSLDTARRNVASVDVADSPASEALVAAAQSGSERRQITVMFVDLVGSTALSTQMDPEELGELMRGFQQLCSDVVVRYGGFVARFMGDGMLAYFGYPVANEDDVENAIHAALGICSQLAAQPGNLQARVGVASGLVVVGELLSSGETRERAVSGETPNLAARLQAAAEPGHVVVAESSRRLVADAFSFRELGDLVLKGFDTPVRAFEVTGEGGRRSRFEASRAGRGELTGRDTELSLLHERWESVRSGEGEAILLLGEAGIGKSRISHALIGLVRADEHYLLRYQCSPLHSGTPLWPLIQGFLLDAGVSNSDSSEEKRSRLEVMLQRAMLDSAQALSLLGELLGFEPTEGNPVLDVAASQRRSMTLQVLRDYVLALSRQQPVMILFEDIHWTDPSSLEFIEILLDLTLEARVLLLLTSRPIDVPSISGHSQVTRLTLNRLNRGAVAEIVRGIAGLRAVSEDLIAQIASRADGVPLFVEELTRAMLEADSQHDDEATSSAHLTRMLIPESLHDSLMSRLDRVPDLKAITQVAACIGREFDLDLLASVCKLPHAKLEESLERLAEAALIFRRGGPSSSRYIFKHALVRDATYESLLNSRRRDIHRSIADVLEQGQGSVNHELVGMHAAEVDQFDRACAAYLIAGRAAARGFANQEAVALLGNVLKLAAKLRADDERDRLELDARSALGVPLIAVHGYASPEVEKNFRRALDLCDALSVDPGLHFALLRGLWNCLYDRSELVESIRLAHTLVELAAQSGNARNMAYAHRALGSSLKVTGRLNEARKSFQTVLDHPQSWSDAAARVVHGESPEVIAMTYQAWIACLQGRVDSGLVLVENAVTQAQTIGMPIASVFAKCIVLIVLGLRRDVTNCAQHAAQMMQICNEQGFVFWHSHSMIFSGWAQAHASVNPVAVERVRCGLDAWIATGAALHVPTWSCLLAEAELTIGEVDNALATLSHARRATERSGEIFMLPEIDRLHARCLRESGHTDEAVSMLERAVKTARDFDAHWFVLRAARDLSQLHASAGESAAGLGVLDEALRNCHEGENCPDLREARELRGRLAIAC